MQHEQLLTTPRFSVEKRVEVADGGRGKAAYVVVHPGAVVILPLLDARRVVLIRQQRVAVSQVLWELPAGTREVGEAPESTARRELREETGYRAGHMDSLGKFYTSPGILDELMYAYLATDLTFEGQALEEDERIETEVVSVGDVRRMVLSGEIQDGKSIAALALYLLGNQHAEGAG